MRKVAATPHRPEPSSFDSDLWTVHQGDARDIGSLLERAASADGGAGQPFVQTTITSPPYATLVDYGSTNQIGFGQSHADYLKSCRSVFADVHKWTLDSGSLWVVADTLLEGYKRGSASRLVPLPFELAAQAESVGWTLREVIVWRKDRTRPWSHRGKLRNGFEYVLFFVKSSKFTFNVDRLRDTTSLKSWWVKYPERHNPWGMTPDNVWEIPIPLQGSWDNSAARHACPFPPELVRRMVLLSSEEGDVVLDPFAGTGTVVSGAMKERRRGIGVELNPEYVSEFRATDARMPSAPPEAKPVSVMTQRLLDLRMLKYPKELVKQVLRGGITTSQINAVLMEVHSVNYKPARTGYGVIECFVVVADSVSQLERARLSKLMVDVAEKPPLSKFGLVVRSSVVSISQAGQRFSHTSVSVYTKGHTWFADVTMDGAQLEQWIRDEGVPGFVPIISPLHVRQPLEESN